MGLTSPSFLSHCWKGQSWQRPWPHPSTWILPSLELLAVEAAYGSVAVGTWEWRLWLGGCCTQALIPTGLQGKKPEPLTLLGDCPHDNRWQLLPHFIGQVCG